MKWMMAQLWTGRNLASPIPNSGYILLRPLTSDQIRVNAMSWVAQSLAQAGKLPGAAAAASDLRAALEKPDVPGARPLKAITLSYVALMLAEASESALAVKVVDAVFDLLGDVPVDPTDYAFLLRGVAPALLLVGDIGRALKVIDWMKPLKRDGRESRDRNDRREFVTTKRALLTDSARRLAVQGNLKLSLGTAIALDDPEAKAVAMIDVLAHLRHSLAPGELLPCLMAVGEVDDALAFRLPARHCARVLVEVADALVDLGELARATDVVVRLLRTRESHLTETPAKVDALIDMAAALAGIGSSMKAAAVGKQVLGSIMAATPSASMTEEGDDPWVLAKARIAGVLGQISDFDGALAVVRSIDPMWMNRAYALADLAEAMARAGDERAVPTAETLEDQTLRASTLGRIAVVLVEAGEAEKATAVANQAFTALTTLTSSFSGEEPKRKKMRMTWALRDRELKEGAWVLDRAVHALARRCRNGGPVQGEAFHALIATGTVEDPWIEALHIGEAMDAIRAGTPSKAVELLLPTLPMLTTTAEELAMSRAGGVKDGGGAGHLSDDQVAFQTQRAVRWIAEVLILAGGIDRALCVAGTIARIPDADGTTADVLLRLSRGMFDAGQVEPAVQVAESARARSPKDGDVIRTLAHIGHREQAMILWRAELKHAQRRGRDRVFDTLGAGAEVVAATIGGDALWAMFQAITEIEGWWNA